MIRNEIGHGEDAGRLPGHRNPGERWALVNGRIVLPDGIVEGHALVIEEDRIAALIPDMHRR